MLENRESWISHCRAETQRLLPLLTGVLDEAVMKHDLIPLLEWICELESASHVAVPVDYRALAKQIEAAGFAALANCGEAHDPEDAENVARWLVGQAVDYMKSGYPPHCGLVSFIDAWKAKFHSEVK